MENSQPMKIKRESESPAAILADSTKSGLVAVTEIGASGNSSQSTTADTPNGSRKIWTSAELAELRSKAGLVAGALADFQAANGLVVVKNIEYEPGKFSLKIYLVADGLSITKINTPDGLDFDVQPLGKAEIVAAPSGIVAESNETP